MASRQAVLGMDQGGFGFGTKRVFNDVSLLLDDARTALVGENGVGKSTLLKCLSGELELDRGKLIRSRNLRVGFLDQETPPGLEDLSVRDLLARSLARIGAQDEDWRIDVLLDEIGLDPAMADARFASLSGGWRRLLLIAGVARLEEPDILILDEPTNHLDLSNIATLERWLTVDFKLPMLIVSHDRAFLNRVTDRTIFLRADGVHSFKASFSHAREELLRRDAAQAVHRKLEEKEVRRLEKAAARYKVWAVKNPALNKRKNAIETRVAHIEANHTQVYKARERRLGLSDAEIEAKVALRLENLTVATPDGARTLLKVDRFAMAAGDKVALLGTNGAGKSTLLNVLAAAFAARNQHYDGQSPARFNPATRLAYFDQAMSDLPLDESLVDYLTEVEGVTRQDAVRHLAQAGFAFRRIDEPIATFSHGERTRLAFLRMKLTAPNLYLLDEPTNHLDIEGQEALESELEEGEVSCLFVSHDRYFTRTAATRFIEIRKGRLVEVESPDAFFEAQETGPG
ncbi:MAG: ABC-F family ATP-binding cassette domain-containing protein [Caulobacteraceae bacterium]|nr:ABC-F family ATP-binding cassette domain-containing protein [Caulobacteraceae bacterium]